MPNGSSHSPEEWAAVERFFGAHGAALERFAARRNLRLERYYHDAPSWSLLCRHPEGGVAKLEVAHLAAGRARLVSYWWIDDYAGGIRHTRHEAGEAIPAAAIDDGEILEQALRRLLGWRRSELQPHSGYARIWQRQWSEEEFAALGERFPLPKLD